MKKHFRLFSQVVLAAALLSGVAYGDDPNRAKARECFTHAVDLFDNKRFADSLEEFQRSYELAPVFSTLYNIGLVHVALGHPVEAAEAFERYLAQGGDAVPADKRAKVESELAAQKLKIGEIRVAATPAGAEVRLDGKVVGKAPLTESVRAGAGHHRVEVMLDGYRTQSTEVDVLGKGRSELTFQLVAIAAKAAPVSSSAQPVAAVSSAQAQPNPAPIPMQDTGTSPGDVQRYLGWGLGGAGIVGVITGLVLNSKGNSKHEDALDQVNVDRAAANQTESDANNLKTAAGVTIGMSSALIVAGGILLLTVPSQPSRAISVAPWATHTSAGIGAQGAF